jgi:ABC-type branched-subunit amino acid transport system ATPase component
MGFQLQGVGKSFGGIRALDDVSFETPPGVITGLIGPNGSGKTTLFNLLTGFIPADQGEISYRGRRVQGLKPHQVVETGIIRTFQDTWVFPNITVMENMLVPSRNNRLGHLFRSPKRKNRTQKALDLLESVGLATYKDDPAGSLSYGQSKLLELALSFMLDADIILLDEPCSGINPTLQEKINEWIIRENRGGKEFFIIEHNMDVIMRLCHHIVVLNHGRKLAEGEPRVIQQDDRVLEAYLGD